VADVCSLMEEFSVSINPGTVLNTFICINALMQNVNLIMKHRKYGNNSGKIISLGNQTESETSAVVAWAALVT